MRTATSKTYYLGEEQFELGAYGDDIHYLDDRNVYRDIDNRWVLKDGV